MWSEGFALMGGGGIVVVNSLKGHLLLRSAGMNITPHNSLEHLSLVYYKHALFIRRFVANQTLIC
jgi:hypothetical protein